MTPDEIMALPADRLVAEVAVRVLRMQKCERFLCLPEYGCRCPVHETMVEWPAKGVYWNPLKDTKALALVHERIRELGKTREFGEQCFKLMILNAGHCDSTETDTARLVMLSPLDHLRAALLAVAGDQS